MTSGDESGLIGLTVGQALEILKARGIGNVGYRPARPPRDPAEAPGDDWRVASVRIDGEGDAGKAVLTVCKPVQTIPGKGVPPDGR